MDRENVEGYVITDRFTVGVGDAEFVIGERAEPAGIADFVTWKCRKGERDYFWGHYCNDRLSAVEDLCRRAQEEVQYLRSFQPKRTVGDKQPRKPASKTVEIER